MNIISLHLIEQWMRSFWGWLNSGGSYEEVHLSPGHRPEPTMRRFAYLRNRGIRCRLIYLGSGGARVMPAAGSVSLRIHREDLPKARSLMREVRD